MRRIVIAAAVLAAWAAPVGAQPTEVARSTVTVTARITAIDQKTRSITLRAEDGTEETLTAGPAVERFDQLKQGDTIKATYQESWVVEVKKGGGKTTTGAVLGGGRLADVPGGALATVRTATVTVKAIDLKAPTITVATDDGRTLVRKVADVKNLANVAVGDQIEISFTQSLMVRADAAK